MELPKKGDIFITSYGGAYYYDLDHRWSRPEDDRRDGKNPQINIFLGVEKGEDLVENLVYWDSKMKKIYSVAWGEQNLSQEFQGGSQLWLQKDKSGWFLQARSINKTCPVLLELLRQG